MTPEAAAAKLGISRSLVYKLCKAGLLGHHRVGVGKGLLRISEAQLGAYLARCGVPAVAARIRPGLPMTYVDPRTSGFGRNSCRVRPGKSLTVRRAVRPAHSSSRGGIGTAGRRRAGAGRPSPG